MNVKQTRKYEMLLRVRDFGTAHQQAFSESTVAQRAFAAVTAAVDELKMLNVVKRSASISQRARRTRSARTGLRELLGQVSCLARVLRAAGLETSPFELPKSRSDHALRMAGHQFAHNAKTLAAEFTVYGLAPSRIDEAIATFETAIRDRGTSRGKHIVASRQIHELLAKACFEVRRLDVIIANLPGADPVIQKVWTEARRIEDRRRHRTAATDQANVAA